MFIHEFFSYGLGIKQSSNGIEYATKLHASLTIEMIPSTDMLQKWSFEQISFLESKIVFEPAIRSSQQREIVYATTVHQIPCRVTGVINIQNIINRIGLSFHLI